MKKYNYNTEVFTNNNAISYYLLGCFITDGNITVRNNTPVRVSITSIDIDWITSIRDLICPKLKITKDNRSNAYTVCIYNKLIGQWLMTHNCIPDKSLTVSFPNNIPDKYLKDFIRGCIDGDGSLFNKKYKKKCKNKEYEINSIYCCLYTGSNNFAIGFSEYLKYIGVNHTIIITDKKSNKLKNGKTITPTPNTKYYCIRIQSNKDINNFLSFIYYDGHQMSLYRKNRIAQLLIKKTSEYINRDTSFSDERKNNISKALQKHAAKGTAVATAKLDENKIIEIRNLYFDNNKTIAIIAKQFNVNWSTIKNIVIKKTWKHI